MVELLETNLAHLSHGDYIVTVDSIADILVNHPRFEMPWPDVVPDPTQLKAQLNDMRQVLTAAAAGDLSKGSEVAAIRAESQRSLVFAAQYLVMKSVKEKDPSMLQNVGFKLKVRTHHKIPDTVSGAPLDLRVKHGPASGMVYATAVKVSGAVSFELQVCEGDPSDEKNWRSVGMYRTCYRMKVQGLTEATKCHFRVRGYGADGPGPWSQVASLVIL